jgi:ankyrin repeat protein
MDLIDNEHEFNTENGLVQQLFNILVEIPDFIFHNDIKSFEKRTHTIASDFSVTYVLDGLGLNMLHHAVYYRSKLFVDYVFMNGLNINEQSLLDGSSPLHIAARMHSYDFIEILVNLGANIMLRDTRGDTPLDAMVGSLHLSAAKKRSALSDPHRLAATIRMLIRSPADFWRVKRTNIGKLLEKII